MNVLLGMSQAFLTEAYLLGSLFLQEDPLVSQISSLSYMDCKTITKLYDIIPQFLCVLPLNCIE